MWLAMPGDGRAARADQQWMLGPDVVVAPVVTRGATSRQVLLPRGCWMQQEVAGAARVRGPRVVTAAAPLGRLPYFFRCGRTPF